MGLDITVYTKIVGPLNEHERDDDCYDDDHLYAFAYDGMEQSLRGLVAGRCYNTDGGWGFRAGSYSGYNRFRENLCKAALGVPPETVWFNFAEYRDKPFFELINFADNEGTIGPEAAADLARDFEEHRERILPQLDEYDAEKYDTWAKAFKDAAGSGAIAFH